MDMTPARLDALQRVYRDGLLGDVLPFWLRHAIDRDAGGYLHCLGRAGEILDTDKSIWIQGRFAWLLATLHRTVEARGEWLDLARHGLDFLDRHGFDADGRMFFRVTREGQPLIKRRYLFSECFTILAWAAYARASGDKARGQAALDLFRKVIHWHATPGALPPKVNPETRPQKGLAMPMILLVTAQELRDATGDPLADEWIERARDEIARDFLHPELQCVLETVGPGGEFLDGFDGRLINPGHAIEAAWFILHEAARRHRDPQWIALGCQILDWSWEIGWDPEFGGLFYFRDALGLPATEYWHDMKYWWPHAEAIIATLLAYHLTGDPKYAAWHAQVHDWAHERFPDPEFGEWFGYLHRDGRLSTPLKGNFWKGPFHIPRMQWYCDQLIAAMKAPTT